jgi:chaperonin GroES
MPLRPLGKRILIEPFEREVLTPGGIHIPEQMADPQCQGVVRAVSSKFGKEHEVPEVGDSVWFRRSYGTEVELNGKKHILIEHEYVLGVVT